MEREAAPVCCSWIPQQLFSLRFLLPRLSPSSQPWTPVGKGELSPSVCCVLAPVEPSQGNVWVWICLHLKGRKNDFCLTWWSFSAEWWIPAECWNSFICLLCVHSFQGEFVLLLLLSLFFSKGIKGSRYLYIISWYFYPDLMWKLCRQHFNRLFVLLSFLVSKVPQSEDALLLNCFFFFLHFGRFELNTKFRALALCDITKGQRQRTDGSPGQWQHPQPGVHSTLWHHVTAALFCAPFSVWKEQQSFSREAKAGAKPSQAACCLKGLCSFHLARGVQMSYVPECIIVFRKGNTDEWQAVYFVPSYHWFNVFWWYRLHWSTSFSTRVLATPLSPARGLCLWADRPEQRVESSRTLTSLNGPSLYLETDWTANLVVCGCLLETRRWTCQSSWHCSQPG